MSRLSCVQVLRLSAKNVPLSSFKRVIGWTHSPLITRHVNGTVPVSSMTGTNTKHLDRRLTMSTQLSFVVVRSKNCCFVVLVVVLFWCICLMLSCFVVFNPTSIINVALISSMYSAIPWNPDAQERRTLRRHLLFNSLSSFRWISLYPGRRSLYAVSIVLLGH